MKVQDILTDKSKWTTSWTARDANGNPVEPTDRKAVCWCLIGACEKAYGRGPLFVEVTNELYRRLKLVGKWNDEPGRTFAEVRGLIEELDI